ncbi:MAG: hypothetical protein PHT12_06565 [Patescibacteria group bacterium]|nr:hypothetical protein [Patescibacteria group bacterium]
MEYVVIAEPDEDGIFTQTVAELMGRPRFVDELVEAYMAVFNAVGPGEWHEAHTPDGARRLLVDDSASEANQTHVTTWRQDGGIRGFSVVLCLPKGRFDWRHLVPATIRGSGLPGGLLEAMEASSRNASGIAYFKELGVVQEHRKGIRPMREILACGYRIAVEANADFMCCRTSKRSSFFLLMSKVGVPTVFDFNDAVGHVIMADGLCLVRQKLGVPVRLKVEPACR